MNCKKIKKYKKTQQTKRRAFTENNVENFRNCLRNLSWRNVLDEQDVDSSFNVFWSDFSMLFDINFPYQRFKFNKNVHKKSGFMTNGLMISRAKKNKLRTISLNDPTIANIEKFKTYRNQYNKLTRAMKQLYYEQNIAKNKKILKKMWELIKEISTGTKSSLKIEKLKANGKTLTNNIDISNEFNNFFTGIGQKISTSIIPSVRTAESYLTIDENIPNIELNPINQSSVIDIVKAMEGKSSLDSDELSTSLLMNIVFKISIPLAHIFSLSITTGTFPNKLRTARVIPIFKSGDPELTDNYRPISLLSSLSKILEKAIAVQLVNHLERNNLIYKHQYGFQKNKNTEHNLISAVNYIHSALRKWR